MKGRSMLSGRSDKKGPQIPSGLGQARAEILEKLASLDGDMRAGRVEEEQWSREAEALLEELKKANDTSREALRRGVRNRKVMFWLLLASALALFVAKFLSG